MKKVVVIPLGDLEAHVEAFMWLDSWVKSSYSFFGRLVLDAFFTANHQRPTPKDLARAFFNFAEENRRPNPKVATQIPDVVIEHIEAAAEKALASVNITKQLVEFEFGPVRPTVGYDLEPSCGFDLIFSYIPEYEPLEMTHERYVTLRTGPTAKRLS